MRENHYAISCISLKISYVFNKQDTHNASYFLKCRASVWPAMANLWIIFLIEKFIWNKCEICGFFITGNHLGAKKMIPCGNIHADDALRATHPHTHALICKSLHGGEWKLNVTNLRILPWKGKMAVTAGSPEVGARGERCPPQQRNPETGCINMC